MSIIIIDATLKAKCFNKCLLQVKKAKSRMCDVQDTLKKKEFKYNLEVRTCKRKIINKYQRNKLKIFLLALHFMKQWSSCGVT